MRMSVMKRFAYWLYAEASRDDGAVTVDFVVLCGLVVGISLIGANTIYTSLTDAIDATPISAQPADGT